MLNRRTDEIELYRVKDFSFEEPFIYRLFGLANIRIETSDRTCPTVWIRALPSAKEFREALRSSVEDMRLKKRVREVDFE